MRGAQEDGGALQGGGDGWCEPPGEGKFTFNSFTTPVNRANAVYSAHTLVALLSFPNLQVMMMVPMMVPQDAAGQIASGYPAAHQLSAAPGGAPQLANMAPWMTGAMSGAMSGAMGGALAPQHAASATLAGMGLPPGASLMPQLGEQGLQQLMGTPAGLAPAPLPAPGDPYAAPTPGAPSPALYPVASATGGPSQHPASSQGGGGGNLAHCA